MKILPIHKDILRYLKDHALEGKFDKQRMHLEVNIFHPSLGTELLEPKHLKIWSFMVDKKYRAIFVFHNSNTIEILDVNNHYK